MVAMAIVQDLNTKWSKKILTLKNIFGQLRSHTKQALTGLVG